VTDPFPSLSDANAKMFTRYQSLTSARLAIFSQYESLTTLADVGTVSTNTNMLTAMVDRFADIFTWE